MVSSTSSQSSYIDNKQPFLNRAGYIPVVSTVTGTIRAVGATFIAVCQVAKAVFYQIAISIETLKHRSGNKDALAGKIASLQQQKNDALALVRDMLLHVGRGLIEVVPFVGSLGCKIYDKKAEPNNKGLEKQFSDLKNEIENLDYQTATEEQLQDIIIRDLEISCAALTTIEDICSYSEKIKIRQKKIFKQDAINLAKKTKEDVIESKNQIIKEQEIVRQKTKEELEEIIDKIKNKFDEKKEIVREANELQKDFNKIEEKFDTLIRKINEHAKLQIKKNSSQEQPNIQLPNNAN